MKQLSPRDRRYFCIIAAVAFVSAAWKLGVGLMEERAGDIKASIEQLQKEYKKEAAVSREIEKYREMAREYNEEFETMLKRYPAVIEKEDQIALASCLERELGIRIKRLDYEGQNQLYEFESFPEEGEKYTLTENPISITVSCDYETWKKIIPYVFNREEKTAVSSVSAIYDKDSHTVESRITIIQYAITRGRENRKEGTAATSSETGSDILPGVN